MSRRVCLSAIGHAPFEARPTYRESVDYARQQLDHWMDKVLPDKPDLIAFRECCDRPSGYSRAECLDYYQERGMVILDHLRARAAREGTNIAYSAVVQAKDGWMRNRTTFIARDGSISGIYNKNHLVWEENTETSCKFGREAPLIDLDFGRVGGVICFDLNFDELREKYVRSRPDLLVFCSMYHGGFVQQHWAYSCRSWFVGAVAGLPCSVIDPTGRIVAQSTNYFPYVTCTVNLDCVVAHLDYNWDRLDAIRAKYGRGVHVSDPGLLGSVLVTSETEGVSAADMASEFGLELLDDYMARSLAHRHMPGLMEEDPW